MMITALLTAVMLIVVVAEAKPPSGKKGKSSMASTLLVQKDENWNELPFPGGVFGQIKYDTTDSSTMHLQLHGLTSNNWYLVTFQDPTGNDQFSNNNADGLFGVKGTGTGFEWVDLALVKTNGGGQANVVIPTAGGLHNDGGTPGEAGYVPGINTAPSLGSGSYSGITVVVKDVGTSADGTTPDMTELMSGGTPKFFEHAALEDFSVPASPAPRRPAARSKFKATWCSLKK